MNQTLKNTDDIKELRKDVNKNKSRLDTLETRTLVSLESINKKLNKIHKAKWNIFQNIAIGGLAMLVIIMIFF